MAITTVLDPPSLTSVPEAAADDAAPEVRLAAVLQVHGADLLTSAGQIAEQVGRDGGMHPWLLAGIKRAVGRLNEAVTDFENEKPAHG